MTQYKHQLISLFIFLIYISFFIIFGENSYILIHDNMDSTAGLYKILIQSGMIFSQN